MKRVTGIGGLFFKCEDPNKMKEWYNKHLDFPTDKYGATFVWRDDNDPNNRCLSQWSTFDSKTDYFEPSRKDFMFNYRVHDLVALLKVLKEEGVEQVGEMEVFEYGKSPGSWIQRVIK